MSELLHQLGIDWRLFLSQAVNFLILLLVLRVAAYKPLMALIKERRARIEEGLTKADEADRKLGEMNELAKNKMKETDAEALRMLKQAEQRAKDTEASLLEEAGRKEAALMAEADLIIKARAEEMRTRVEREAAELVRQAIERTVELKPAAVDEALVKQALKDIRHSA